MVRPFTSSIAFGRFLDEQHQLRLEARGDDTARGAALPVKEEALLVRLSSGTPTSA